MKRLGLPALLACLAPGVASAADCARVFDGHSALAGQATTRGPMDAASVAVRVRVERGAHTRVTMQKSGEADVATSELDHGMLIRSSRTQPALSQTFAVSEVEGDMRSLRQGDESGYRLTVTRDDGTKAEEMATQTVGPRSKRVISGCEVETVRITRVYKRVGAEIETRTVSDYAPALGFSLASDTVITLRGAVWTNAFTLETLEAE